MTNETEVLNAACRESFDIFAAKAFEQVEPDTNYEWNWHIGCLNEHLEALYNSQIQRLIINIPPRCLKSFSAARAFPAWAMGKKPSSKFIVTSYGHEVVEQSSMACRQIMKSPWYKEVFPETVISSELDRNTHFVTTKAGQYYATTVLSPMTGMGCDYMVADDLLKPNEALSEAIRNSTNTAIRNTLFSRFNDKRTGKFLMIMQRLHVDDPTGHLMADGGYTLLKLPAETKTQIIISLGNHQWVMPENSLLFPARMDAEILARMRLDMTEYNYAGQILQEPVPIGGGEFREEWPQYYSEGSIRPKQMNLVILVDPAGGDELNRKKKKTSDWTAYIVVGLAPDNNYYILDIIRDRLNPTERVDTLFKLHRKWNELAGKPPKVGYEKIALMSDTHYINIKMDEDGYRFPLFELGGTIEKTERIRQMIPDLQHNRWYMPYRLPYVDKEGRKFDLINELIYSEMLTFPRAKFDDMLDATSRVYEESLGLVFPKLKTVTQKLGAIEPESQDWMDF